jgi:hypothetical protein
MTSQKNILEDTNDYINCQTCHNLLPHCHCKCPYCNKRDECECALFDAATGG